MDGMKQIVWDGFEIPIMNKFLLWECYPNFVLLLAPQSVALAVGSSVCFIWSKNVSLGLSN